MQSEFDFKGMVTAVATPFLDGQLDELSFRKLIRFQLEEGAQGVVVNGSTGEMPVLSEDEIERLIKIAKEETEGKIPVIAGSGTNCTSSSVRRTLAVESYGADAALVVVPYYSKPPQRGLLIHFQQVARNTNLPILLYNVPSRTVASLSVETIAELAKEPNIVGMKEATGDLKFDREILEATRNSSFFVTSGDDPTCMELALMGGCGIISVVSNLIPGPLTRLMRSALQKEKSSVEKFEAYRNLLKAVVVETNPIPVKMGLHLMDIFQSPELRSPLVQLEADKVEYLKSEMEKAKVLSRSS